MDYGLKNHYNIAPTEQIPVIVQETQAIRDIRDMRWWLLPNWVDQPSTKYSMFNARSENLLTSKAFSKPFKSNRCVIPVSGYYEWQKSASGKLPFYIRPEIGNGFAFAGICDRWQRGDQVIESCAIVTTEAHGAIRHVHHRMPVQLSSSQIDEWLDKDTPANSLQRMFVPRLAESLEIIPVSTHVNNARNKDEQCVQPIAESQIVH